MSLSYRRRKENFKRINKSIVNTEQLERDKPIWKDIIYENKPLRKKYIQISHWWIQAYNATLVFIQSILGIKKKIQ